MAILRDGSSDKEILTVPDVASLPATGSEGDLYLVLDIDEFREWDTGTSSWVEPTSVTGSSTHDLGGATHTADTLANLNSKVSDATLIDTADSRLSDARTPTAHDLAGSEHNADTLADLNSKISDATLIDTGDSRLSDARTPTAHDLAGAEHNADTLSDLNGKVSDATLFGVAHGSTYISTTTTTSVDQTPTFTKIAGTYTPGELNGFTHSAGVLTYTGSLTKKFLVTASISADATVADTYYFRIAKDGTSIAASQMTRAVGSADIGSISLSWVVELATNATIEVQTARAGTTSNLSNAEVTLNVCAVS